MLNQFGNKSIHAVSWQSQTTQYVRFDTLLQNSIPNKTDELTLLDLGCGLGDMYDYLLKNGYTNVVYTGYDIVPEMIAAAEENYPAAEFEVKNFLEDNLPNMDIICASGSLNLVFDNAANQIEYIKKAVTEMYKQSRVACAFNLLDKDNEWMYEKDPMFYYTDKQEIYKYCQTFCPNARLISGYLPNDFTIILPKR